MANYEIMFIIDPKEDVKTVETMVKDVLGKGLKEFKKMDRTELAYPINNSTTAQYVLVTADVEGSAIKELTRKVNISKTIWRQLSINLDSERAVDSLKNMKKFEEMKARRAAERASFRKDSPKREFKKEAK